MNTYSPVNDSATKAAGAFFVTFAVSVVICIAILVL